MSSINSQSLKIPVGRPDILNMETKIALEISVAFNIMILNLCNSIYEFTKCYKHVYKHKLHKKNLIFEF